MNATLNRRFQTLLRDFGYEVQGNVIIQLGIRGFTSDRIFRRCQSPMDACEQLIPIVGMDEFSARYRRLTTID